MPDEQVVVAPTGVHVTLEEVEAQTAAVKAAGEKPDLSKIRLEDGVPDEFKGKTVVEVMQMTTGALASLKVSEARRLELESRPQQQTVVAPPEPKPEPELTKDQLRALYESDPMAAIEYQGAQAERRAIANLEKRILPLIAGSANSAEDSARRKYPDEFALFGPDIVKIIDQVPDKGILSQSKTWDDLIAYVRGQPANFDKLIAHKAAGGRTVEQQRAEAHAAQVAAAGVTIRSTITAPVLAIGEEGLDSLELEIAKGLDMSPADYKLWKGKR